MSSTLLASGEISSVTVTAKPGNTKRTSWCMPVTVAGGSRGQWRHQVGCSAAELVFTVISVFRSVVLDDHCENRIRRVVDDAITLHRRNDARPAAKTEVTDNLKTTSGDSDAVLRGNVSKLVLLSLAVLVYRYRQGAPLYLSDYVQRVADFNRRCLRSSYPTFPAFHCRRSCVSGGCR